MICLGSYLSDNGTEYTEMVQSIQKWYRVHRNGTEYTEMVQSTQKWYRVHRNGTEYAEMVQSTRKWYRVYRNGTEYTEMVQSTQKWYRVHRNGTEYTERLLTAVRVDLCLYAKENLRCICNWQPLHLPNSVRLRENHHSYRVFILCENCGFFTS